MMGIEDALAYARLGPRAKRAAPVKCVGCGKFIADVDLDRSHFYFEPLSEYGPEVTEWTCWRCQEVA